MKKKKNRESKLQLWPSHFMPLNPSPKWLEDEYRLPLRLKF